MKYFISLTSLRYLIILLSLAGLPIVSQAADSPGTEKKVRQLQTDIRELEGRLRAFKGESKNLQAELRVSETKAGKLSQSIRVNQRLVNQGRQQLKALDQEQLRLTMARKEQAKTLGQQLSAAYRTGRQNQIKLLLNQQQPERLSRILRYYEYLNRSQINSIEVYEQTLISLTEVETEINHRQLQLQRQQALLQHNSEQLQVSRRQREKALSQLTRQISGDDKRLLRLKSDRQRLKQVLKQLQQTLMKVDLAWESKEFVQLKGKLKWPTKGRVVQRYGRRSSLGIKNDGMLIGAAMGNQVRVVHHGRVVFSDWLRGFGLLIIVDHGSGYMSLYGHNESLLKEVGDWVPANEIIATVGDSGGLSSTGLYFAIRYKGQPYNPKPWLSRSQG